MKKYELTEETMEYRGVVLHRIKALKDFGDVKAGDLGGWIEKEENLSHDGDAWVYDDAEVYGNARVFDNARVYKGAKVFGNASIFDHALVHDGAQVYENAKVYGSARVSNNAQIRHSASVFEVATISGEITVLGGAQVFHDLRIYGNATVVGCETITDDTNLCETDSFGFFDDAETLDHTSMFFDDEEFDDDQAFGNSGFFGATGLDANDQLFSDVESFIFDSSSAKMDIHDEMESRRRDKTKKMSF